MSDDADLLKDFNSTLADDKGYDDDSDTGYQIHSSQLVNDFGKESVSDEVECTSPTKSTSKRIAEDASDFIFDDPTAQPSGNKLKKEIEVEND
ncbi:hypothetical protein COCNU_contig69376931G000010 [Cocos nucifera]|nr:hypothetical protein [Cocos nucifera]